MYGTTGSIFKSETHTVKAHARLKRKSGDKARLIAHIPRKSWNAF